MKKIFILITLLSFSFTNKLSQADDHLKVLWETEKIFELPESVIYDKKMMFCMFLILQTIRLIKTEQVIYQKLD